MRKTIKSGEEDVIVNSGQGYLTIWHVENKYFPLSSSPQNSIHKYLFSKSIVHYIFVNFKCFVAFIHVYTYIVAFIHVHCIYIQYMAQLMILLLSLQDELFHCFFSMSSKTISEASMINRRLPWLKLILKITEHSQ